MDSGTAALRGHRARRSAPRRLHRRRQRATARREAGECRRDHQDLLRRRERRPAHGRARQDRPGRDGADPRQPGVTHGSGAAKTRDLLQLHGAGRRQPERRLRHPVRPEHRRHRRGHPRRGQDRGQRVPRLPRRRHRAQERDADGADTVDLEPRAALHRHGHVLRLTGHLRRDRHRRRVGAQARLRGRLHRQGHRLRCARPRHQHRQHAERRAGGRDRRRRELELHRGAAGTGADGVQLRVPRPDRRQARAFAAESREGLGQQHAATPSGSRSTC